MGDREKEDDSGEPASKKLKPTMWDSLKPPAQKRGAKKGSKVVASKTAQQWVDAVKLFKSLKHPMSQKAFLQSPISGEFFSGTQSELVSFGKRIKEHDSGKYLGKQLNVKRIKRVFFPEVEAKLVRYIEIRERKFEQDKIGVGWHYLKDQANRFAAQLKVANWKGCSDGWLQKVLRRSNKTSINLHGEKDEMSVEEKSSVASCVG